MCMNFCLRLCLYYEFFKLLKSRASSTAVKSTKLSDDNEFILLKYSNVASEPEIPHTKSASENYHAPS